MDIKALMADRYRTTCNQILARIVGGGLLHIDETHALRALESAQAVTEEPPETFPTGM